MIFKCRPGALFHCTLPDHPYDQTLVVFNSRGQFETNDPKLIEWVSNLNGVECCEQAEKKKRGRPAKG